jgi:Mg-chelatase subunit ChlD
VPVDVMLLMDTSGSMDDEGGTALAPADPPQPITEAQQAAQSFVAALQPNDRAGVVTFATNAALTGQLSAAHDAVARALGGIAILPADERGSTNLAPAISDAAAELASSRHAAGSRPAIVVLTDGRTNEPSVEAAEAAASAAAASAKAAGAQIYTIGLGSEVNDAFLQAIATKPEFYYKAARGTDLKDVYTEISASLCEHGAAIIDVIARSFDTFNSTSTGQ